MNDISIHHVFRCGNGALICYWQYQYMMIGPDKDDDIYPLIKKPLHMSVLLGVMKIRSHYKAINFY